MTGSVSREDPRPLYRQLKELLLADLPQEVGVTSKLASERQLVARYGVSRITVRQAMQQLVHEGHIRSQPGKGFYATGRSRDTAFELELLRSFTATALEHGRRPGSRLLRVGTAPAEPRVAAALKLAEGQPVASLRRLRLLDDVPVAIAEDWIAADKVPGLAALDWGRGTQSLYEELVTGYGIRPERGETVLTSRLAELEEASLLELERPAAVLVVEQIAWDAAGVPINLTLAVHHPERYPLRLEQGRIAERARLP